MYDERYKGMCFLRLPKNGLLSLRDGEGRKEEKKSGTK